MQSHSHKQSVSGQEQRNRLVRYDELRLGERALAFEETGSLFSHNAFKRIVPRYAAVSAPGHATSVFFCGFRRMLRPRMAGEYGVQTGAVCVGQGPLRFFCGLSPLPFRQKRASAGPRGRTVGKSRASGTSGGGSVCYQRNATNRKFFALKASSQNGGCGASGAPYRTA